jgi:hypothetical protein
MENLDIINSIRQSNLINTNPNAIFQKKIKTQNKMIRVAGKTELFETPTSTGELNLFQNAETRLLPETKIETKVSEISTKTKAKVQSPRTQTPQQNTQQKIYTEDELTAKGVTVVILKEILRERGLKMAGKKAELIQRILDAQK